MTGASMGWSDVDKDAEKYVGYLAARTGRAAAYRRQVNGWLEPQPGERLLDVGCGIGDYVLELAAMVGSGGHVTGVDLSEAMIDEARRKAHGLDLPVNFDVGDATRLRFPDESFDRTRASQLLLHLDNPAQTVAEMVGVTRKGGFVMCSESDQGSAVLDAPDKDFTRRFMTFRADAVKNGWVGRQVPRLFKEAGLTDLQVHPYCVTITELDAWNQSSGSPVSLLLERGAQAGYFTPAEGSRWWDRLKADDAGGNFFWCITVLAVRGRRQ